MSSMPGALGGGGTAAAAIWSGLVFHGFLLFSLSIGIVTLGALLVTVFLEGWYVDAVCSSSRRPPTPRSPGRSPRSSRRSSSASC